MKSRSRNRAFLVATLLYVAVAMGHLLAQGVSSESDLLRRMSGIAPLPAAAATPASKQPSERPPGATEITSSEKMTFEQAENKAVFVGDVVVRDPQFTLTAKKLTAYMRRDKGEQPEATPAASPTPAKKKKADSGLERAIAEGNVVIVQLKTDAEGKQKRYEGRGQKVVYVSATDEITLTGSPQVREGYNLHVATDPSTVIVITSSGELETTGPSKTVIVSSKDE